MDLADGHHPLGEGAGGVAAEEPEWQIDHAVGDSGLQILGDVVVDAVEPLTLDNREPEAADSKDNEQQREAQ